jgi:hypothetical protein
MVEVPEQRSPIGVLMSFSIYRPRGSKTVRKTLAMSVETQQGIKQLQAAFSHRFPKDQFPTLSAVLEIVIHKNLAELNANPEWLAEEVKDFQRRYLTAKKGKV